MHQKYRAIHVCGFLALFIQGCATNATNVPVVNNKSYPAPDSYLIGKPVENVVRVLGNPQRTNSVGNTLFISYTGYGRRGSNYDNICFLEIQADRTTGLVRQAKIGSNLGIDNPAYGLNVRQDCNRVFLKTELSQR